MVLEIVKTIVGWIWTGFGDRRRIRLTVHRACFLNDAQECFFINATNLSRNRELELTHIWFDCGRQVPALQAARPLPKRLKPEETWETWVSVNEVPTDLWGKAYTLARARLSNGAIIRSIENVNVPHFGNVPGGPVGPKKSE